MSKVMMIANDTNFVWNLRREVLEKLISEACEVTLMAQVLGFRDKLNQMGCKVVDVNTGRRGTNPFADMRLFWDYLCALKREKPDVVLTNNIKPNVYAGLACRILKIPYMPNVCGLGAPLEAPGLMQRLTAFLYRIGVKDAKTIFFQNEENRLFFERHTLMPRQAKVIVIPGSGVNLETHPLLPWPEGRVHFLFAARIMKQKGIDLFLAAARRYASDKVVFDICGQCDDAHYRKILRNEKCVCYHGLQSDMLPFYGQCSCLLYPSYYPEGMSNVLLEAAACGRPVIAADRAGCRETVEHGVTGYLVPVKNEEKVLEAVEEFLRLSVDERKRMGLSGRWKVERAFDRKIVVDTCWREVKQAIGKSHG